jgi:superfamily II DNA/RNA helicase
MNTSVSTETPVSTSVDNFYGFGLPEILLEALAGLNFTAPTAVQAAAIPVALTGQDVLATAQTGTGKTAAYGIPMIAHLLSHPNSTALVMTPTRELAVQVLDQLQKFAGKQHGIKSALLIGGEGISRQFNQLRQRPRLIVGTPGRIFDHLNRRSLDLSTADFLVLDEADRMLDMGFGIQLEQIATYLPTTRQTLLFSATLPKNIIKLSEKYLTNPERIAIGSTTAVAPNIKQEVIQTNDADKYGHLLNLLEDREGSVIVFVKTKHGAARLAETLVDHDHAAEAIHGDLRQRERAYVIQGFRDKEYRIMVATDVAARGLDIPHIAHVINYDLPQCPEDYIHRIGRTARAGATGSAVCLVTPGDRIKWRAIHRLMNPEEAAAAEQRDRGNSRGGANDRFSARPNTSRPNSNSRFAGRDARGDQRTDHRGGGDNRRGGQDDRSGNRGDSRGGGGGRDSRDGFAPRSGGFGAGSGSGRPAANRNDSGRPSGRSLNNRGHRAA